jgi:hypothetical protein
MQTPPPDAAKPIMQTGPCPPNPCLAPGAGPQGNTADRPLFPQTNDPSEPLSRSIIDAKQFGHILIDPAAKVYGRCVGPR